MTENLRKEQLSLAYFRAIAGIAGLSLSISDLDDDSVDIQVQASGNFDAKSPRLDIQLKATANPSAIRPDAIALRVKRKNYDDLRRETMLPRLLVVLVLPTEPDEWYSQDEEKLSLRRAAYWLSLRAAPAVDQESITIYIPRTQLLSPEAMRKLMVDSTWRPMP
jgi:Domain of unknown function (DUF4365)